MRMKRLLTKRIRRGQVVMGRLDLAVEIISGRTVD
jgi:hypothetical protein